MTSPRTHEDFKRFGDGHLPGHLGVEILTVTREAVESRMQVRREVMAPNGDLHAAVGGGARRHELRLRLRRGACRKGRGASPPSS